MSQIFNTLVHPYVQSLKPYLPGKAISEIQTQYQIEHVIKLASNENAWGTSPKALQAVQRSNMEDICHYPHTYLHPLFKHLQNLLNVPNDYLLITAGSDAVFSLLMQAYAVPKQKNILTHEYAFMGYEIQARAHGLNCLKSQIDSQTWALDIEHLIQQSQHNVAITFIANPNNPTGTKMSWSDIEYINRQIPKKSLLVIDQAYAEYDPEPQPNLYKLIQKHPNIIMTRTFSKAYGLASLRVGYAIAHPEITDTLKKIQLPFTISQISLNAASAACEDQAFILETIKNTALEKQFLVEHLKNLPFEVQNGYGNFVTLRKEKNTPKLVQFLESKGIIIRPLASFGLQDCVRITVGQHQENQQLLNLMKQYYHSSSQTNASI